MSILKGKDWYQEIEDIPERIIDVPVSKNITQIMDYKKITEIIKSMGIIPEDEHYEIAEAVIKECENRLREEGDLAKIQAFTGSTYK